MVLQVKACTLNAQQMLISHGVQRLVHMYSAPCKPSLSTLADRVKDGRADAPGSSWASRGAAVYGDCPSARNYIANLRGITGLEEVCLIVERVT